MSTNKRVIAIAALAWLASAAGMAAETTSGGSEVRLHAMAVNMSNVGQTGTFPLDIGITRWSTDAEAKRLQDVLRENGPEAVAGELQKMERAGFIRHSSGGLGWSLRYARRAEMPGGGYRVVFATDRPISFSERLNRTRATDYDLIFGEVRIGGNGKGEGKLVPMATVSYNEAENTIEIDNYASQPVRLTSVVDVSSKSEKQPARQGDEPDEDEKEDEKEDVEIDLK